VPGTLLFTSLFIVLFTLFERARDEKIVAAQSFTGQTPEHLFRAAMIDALDINEVMTKYLSRCGAGKPTCSVPVNVDVR